MTGPTLRTALALTLALGLAAGGFAAPAAASSVSVDLTVEVNDQGGSGGFVCTGSPTDHECDKAGTLTIGPLTMEYEGYNDDDFAGRTSEFGDDFDVAVGDREGSVEFDCSFGPGAPSGNPCPVQTATPGGNSDDAPGQGDERSNASDVPDERANENGSANSNALDDDEGDTGVELPAGL